MFRRRINTSIQILPYPNVDSSRLAVIEPSENSQALVRCKLRHFTFAEKPKYEALSYMWGDKSHQRTILVHGKEFLVGCATTFAWCSHWKSGLDRCNLHLSRSIPNGISQKLEVWTSVFWGVSFCKSDQFIRLRIALPILWLDLRLYILALKCSNFTFRRSHPKSKIKPFFILFLFY